MRSRWPWTGTRLGRCLSLGRRRSIEEQNSRVGLIAGTSARAELFQRIKDGELGDILALAGLSYDRPDRL